MAVVLMSAVVSGMSTDFQARNPGEDPPSVYRCMELVLFGCFMVELLLSAVAYGKTFFTMFGWAWNVYDLILVMLQMTEEVLLLMDLDQAGNSVGVMRLLRILRSFRCVRILRLMRFTEDLQVLVSCISHSMKSFSWALCLLFLIIYVASIYLAQTVAEARAEDMSEDASAELELWYGGVPVSVLSLFQALTGGLDWHDVVRPLFEEVSWFAGGLITLFIAFSLLVIMNIFTGLMVETALRRLKEVRDEARVRTARAMFEKMSWDLSGKISLDQITNYNNIREVKDFFKDIDVDVSQAQDLFELLDVDHSGFLEFEEFLAGCLRLQGELRTVDLLLVAKESRASSHRTAELLCELQEQVQALSSPGMMQHTQSDSSTLVREPSLFLKPRLRKRSIEAEGAFRYAFCTNRETV